jgi:hypothetical protein
MHEEAMRKVYLFQPHQHTRYSYCGVEVCNAITQSPIQGIESAIHMIHDIKQNNMNDKQIFIMQRTIKSINMTVQQSTAYHC